MIGPRRRRPLSGRRRFLFGLLAVGPRLPPGSGGVAAQERRYGWRSPISPRSPGITLEGTGFTRPGGPRELRARRSAIIRSISSSTTISATTRGRSPTPMTPSPRRSISTSSITAIPPTNAAIAEKLKAAGIPVLALNYAGAAAPRSTPSTTRRPVAWPERLSASSPRATGAAQTKVGGDRSAPSAPQRSAMPERVQGVTAGAPPAVARAAGDDARHEGQSGAGRPAARASSSPRHPTGEATRRRHRRHDRAGGQGGARGGGPRAGRRHRQPRRRSHDPRRHERAEGDRPQQSRAASSSDRSRSTSTAAGYGVLPLAMRMLQGETVPPRATAGHLLVTAANVFIEYPPYDMN